MSKGTCPFVTEATPVDLDTQVKPDEAFDGFADASGINDTFI